MNKSFFNILGTEFNELEKIGYLIDENLLTNPHAAIVTARLFAEKLLEEVAKKEELEFIITMGQHERIQYLSREGIINKDIVDALNIIRVTGNRAVHEGVNNDLEYSIKIHKRLYYIVSWFIETYSNDYSISIPEYSAPSIEYKKESLSEEDIQRILLELTKVLPSAYSNIQPDTATIEENENVVPIVKDELSSEVQSPNYVFIKKNNSYLINELMKLGDFSQEAVESYECLNDFKKYMHVERSIQHELIDMLKASKESSNAQLIIMAGNVGDGKSHLLAYLNEEYPEIMNSFLLHNDATESFNPQLTEIDTLKNLLNPFKDINLEDSNEKLILAINLGVLHNFLSTPEAENDYKILKKFISDSDIFNQDKGTQNVSTDYFKLVSFGDYNIYELTENGPKSEYITSILKKITNFEDNNPFYQAYKLDIEANISNPVLINYEILSQPGVVERITQLVIATMVKSKKILGTRELLNFVYEILVPSNIGEYDEYACFNDNLSSLLPNSLFDSIDRGSMLKLISNEDPMKYRHEEIDKLLIMINISMDVKQIIMPYFTNQSNLISKIFDDFYEFHNYSSEMKSNTICTIVRLLYLLGEGKVENIFKNPAYDDYMKYLYYYNVGQGKEYKIIFDETREAIFNWNGSPENNYIYLNEELDNFKISEKLEFKPSNKKGMRDKSLENVLERFKTTITLGYEILTSGSVEAIEVDYQLYNIIRQINEGYFANKKDREEALVLVEFIDKLLHQGNMENELRIKDTRDKLEFTLRYENDFEEEFIFERLER